MNKKSNNRKSRTTPNT